MNYVECIKNKLIENEVNFNDLINGKTSIAENDTLLERMFYYIPNPNLRDIANVPIDKCQSFDSWVSRVYKERLLEFRPYMYFTPSNIPCLVLAHNKIIYYDGKRFILTGDGENESMIAKAAFDCNVLLTNFKCYANLTLIEITLYANLLTLLGQDMLDLTSPETVHLLERVVSATMTHLGYEVDEYISYYNLIGNVTYEKPTNTTKSFHVPAKSKPGFGLEFNMDFEEFELSVRYSNCGTPVYRTLVIPVNTKDLLPHITLVYTILLMLMCKCKFTNGKIVACKDNYITPICDSVPVTSIAELEKLISEVKK